ncbi:MAG: hypothetical protein KDD11_04755 [Acidobacteria bacterium]|nr:hypothetical protein [Acidobacteriota bacterium]
MSESPRPRRLYLVGGVIVVAVALWLLLEAAGLPVPELARWWPVFVILGGLASLADFFVGSREAGSIGKGVFGIGVACLCLGFTVGSLSWSHVGSWAPALPLIFGAAFLAAWIADGFETSGFLVAGLVGVGLGLTFYGFHYDWLARILPSPAVLWGILLLILGAFLLWRNFRPKSGPGEG